MVLEGEGLDDHVKGLCSSGGWLQAEPLGISFFGGFQDLKSQTPKYPCLNSVLTLL